MNDFLNTPESDVARGHSDGFEPMTVFDKVCAVLAIPFGVVFMILGAIGLFTGSSAHFTLPPILGAIPFFVGWAMSVPLIRYWKISNRRRRSYGMGNPVAHPTDYDSRIGAVDPKQSVITPTKEEDI